MHCLASGCNIQIEPYLIFISLSTHQSFWGQADWYPTGDKQPNCILQQLLPANRTAKPKK